MIIFHDIIDLLHLQIGMVIYPSSRLESHKMTTISPCHTTASEVRQSLVACGEFPYRKFPCRRVSWDNPSINRGIFSLPCALCKSIDFPRGQAVPFPPNAGIRGWKLDLGVGHGKRFGAWEALWIRDVFETLWKSGNNPNVHVSFIVTRKKLEHVFINLLVGYFLLIFLEISLSHDPHDSRLPCHVCWPCLSGFSSSRSWS